MQGGKITWSVPFSAHKDAALAALRMIFSAMAFVRMALLFTVIFFSVRYALIRTWPEIEVHWIRVFLVCIGSMFMLAGMGCVAALSPPRITVSAKGVFVNNGQSGTWYFYKDMASIHIDDHATPFAVLCVSFLTGRPTAKYPIDPQVSLDDLRSTIERYRFGANDAVGRETA